MTLPDRLRRSLFQLKLHALRPASLRFAAALEREERLSADELQALNWSRRQAIFRHAIAASPFYRRKYAAAGLDAGSLRLPEDWASVPPLEKAELRASFAELRADGVRDRDTALSTTGGSTGEPVRVLFDRRVPLEAFGWRVLDWWGVDPADSAAFVFRKVRAGASAALNAALWWPTRRVFLDASSFDSGDARRFLKTLERVRPAYLQGYVGAMADLADEQERLGADLRSLRAVWVTSAPLSEAVRRKIEAAFGAPAYDQYGCGEVFWVGCECSRQRGLHVFHGRRHVEFLGADGRPGAPGELGDLLLTDLENRAFPLIRYAGGDRGRWLDEGPCDCGIGLPRMDGVKGRVSDSLRLSGGRILSGDYLTTIFDAHPEAVDGFQVVQRRADELLLRVVPRAAPGTDAVLAAVVAGLEAKCAGEARVRLERVARIAHDGGKTRFIVREVP